MKSSFASCWQLGFHIYTVIIVLRPHWKSTFWPSGCIGHDNEQKQEEVFTLDKDAEELLQCPGQNKKGWRGDSLYSIHACINGETSQDSTLDEILRQKAWLQELSRWCLQTSTNAFRLRNTRIKSKSPRRLRLAPCQMTFNGCKTIVITTVMMMMIMMIMMMMMMRMRMTMTMKMKMMMMMMMVVVVVVMMVVVVVVGCSWWWVVRGAMPDC